MKTIPLHTAAPAAAVGPAAAQAGPWRLARLWSAPHRLGFFTAALLMAGTALWWAFVLVARYSGWSIGWAVLPMVAHGLLMTLGFMPLFIVGFLFTAGPKWLGLPDVPASTLRRPVAAMLLGWLVALAGFHLSPPWAAMGMMAATLGWMLLMGRWLRLLRASRVPDRLHAKALLVAGLAGGLSMAAGTVAVLSGDVLAARAATQLGLWGFLAPTFTVVAHRMLPFFTTSALPFLQAWRPTWLLGVLLVALAVSATGATWQAWQGPLPAWAHGVQLAVQGPAALLVLWLALRWGLLHSLRIRLLAMLHGGFVWLGLALTLSAVSQARVLAWGDAYTLGLAPLHALGMGYLGATLIAMITRVAAGHSGRPLAADNLAWCLYLVLQTAVVLRVAAELWPAATVPLTLAAAAGWALACTGWALRYGNWMGRPRVDGRPG